MGCLAKSSCESSLRQSPWKTVEHRSNGSPAHPTIVAPGCACWLRVHWRSGAEILKVDPDFEFGEFRAYFETISEADPEVSEAIDFTEFYPLSMKAHLQRKQIETSPRGPTATIRPSSTTSTPSSMGGADTGCTVAATYATGPADARPIHSVHMRAPYQVTSWDGAGDAARNYDPGPVVTSAR